MFPSFYSVLNYPLHSYSVSQANQRKNTQNTAASPAPIKNVSFCWCLLRIELESKGSRQESVQCSDHGITLSSRNQTQVKSWKSWNEAAQGGSDAMSGHIFVSRQWNPCNKDKISLWLREANKYNEYEAPKRESNGQSSAAINEFQHSYFTTWYLILAVRSDWTMTWRVTWIMDEVIDENSHTYSHGLTTTSLMRKELCPLLSDI